MKNQTKSLSRKIKPTKPKLFSSVWFFGLTQKLLSLTQVLNGKYFSYDSFMQVSQGIRHCRVGKVFYEFGKFLKGA